MSTAIATWGNSDAVRIPRPILRLAGLRKGDRVDFRVNERGRIELVPATLDVHRCVAPAEGVDFHALFDGYRGSRHDSTDPWPGEAMVGAELEAWSS